MTKHFFSFASILFLFIPFLSTFSYDDSECHPLSSSMCQVIRNIGDRIRGQYPNDPIKQRQVIIYLTKRLFDTVTPSSSERKKNFIENIGKYLQRSAMLDQCAQKNPPVLLENGGRVVDFGMLVGINFELFDNKGNRITNQSFWSGTNEQDLFSFSGTWYSDNTMIRYNRPTTNTNFYTRLLQEGNCKFEGENISFAFDRGFFSGTIMSLQSQ